MGQRSDELKVQPERTVTVRPVTTVTHTGHAHVTSNGAATDSTQLRGEIARTRAEMTETVAAIQERLNPDLLMAKAKEQATDAARQATDYAKDALSEATTKVKSAVREATVGRVETMVKNATDTASDYRQGFFDTIRENPIPAALVGIGLGWLFMNRSSTRRHSSHTDYNYSRGGHSDFYLGGESGYRHGGQPGYRPESAMGNQGRSMTGQYVDRAGHYVGQAQDAVSSLAGQATETASDLASRATEKTSQVAGQALDTASNLAGQAADVASTVAERTQDAAGYVAERTQDAAGYVADRTQDAAGYLTDTASSQYEWTRNQFDGTLRDNPLVIGALAAGLGLAVGLAMPRSEREDVLMGQTRDQLLEQAKAAAFEAQDKIQRVVGDTQEAVRRSAEEHGLTGGTDQSEQPAKPEKAAHQSTGAAF